MMKEEFEQRIGASIPLNHYAIVQRVYAWHPSIPNVGGKDKIAQLYMLGGMDLMRDMDVRAKMMEQRFEELSDQEQEAEKAAVELAEQIAQLDEQIGQLRAKQVYYIARIEEVQRMRKEMIQG